LPESVIVIEMSIRFFFALLAAIFAIGAAAVAAPVTVVDATGNAVSLPAPAQRIVSLAPHATELLFAAGAGKRVVAVISPADWPPEAASLPRVGDAGGLDLERVIALRPDLAVVWPYLAPLQIERLRELGIAVYVSDPRSPAGIAQDIERLGALAGSEEEAGRAAAELRRRIHALERQPRAATKLRVFYEIWNQPLYTIGGRHLITEALRLCGGENVFASLALPAPAVSVEAVLAAAPSVIVAGTDGAMRPDWLDDWRRWRALPAVANGNLFVVDANLLHRAGPRFADGVIQLCAALDQARANLAAH
jgi:iron complex transport system substrate-binding protein